MRQLVNKYNASLYRNTFRNALLMLVACCLLLLEAVAQNANRKIKVTGTVFDEEGLPMIGATIREATTHVGTLTDLNGWYEIQVPANGTLEVSFIGYEKKRINVTGREKINVKLLPDKKTALDEVVVIGYGAVKKADLTGSVSNVKWEISKTLRYFLSTRLCKDVLPVRILCQRPVNRCHDFYPYPWYTLNLGL